MWHTDPAWNQPFFIAYLCVVAGKVFVHCIMGVSRSATLTIAYLMLKHHMPARDALRAVKKRRDINPNQGFLEQLATFNEELRLAGHFKKDKADHLQQEKAASCQHEK